MTFNCKLCNFSSDLKSNYLRHLNTKKHENTHIQCKGNEIIKSILFLDSTKTAQNSTKNSTKQHKKQHKQHKFGEKLTQYGENSTESNIEKNHCELCNKQFKTRPNLLRHKRKYCKNNTENLAIIELKNMIKMQEIKYEKEKKILYKQIEKLIDKAGNTTINNTINLNSYGKEDLSHITDNVKTNMLKIPYGAIPKMIAAVHFNDEKPENKNIALTNKKDNKIKIFSCGKWIYRDKDDTINDLVDGKYFILDNHYNKNMHNINDSVNNRYEEFQKLYDDNDKTLLETLKKDCELVLLNNR
mgnify:CR=1 FL=1